MVIAVDLTKTNITSPVGTDVYTIEMTKALLKATTTDIFILLTTGREAEVFWQQTLGSFSNYKIIELPAFPLITQLQVMLATWKYRHINVLWEPVPTLPVLHRPGLRVVVTIHGELNHSLSEQWSVKFADNIIVVSEATKTNLIRMYGQKEIIIIPEGVDTSVFYPRSTEEVNAVCSKYSLSERYFLFVGTISPRKNLTNLIQALSLIGTLRYQSVRGDPIVGAQPAEPAITTGVRVLQAKPLRSGSGVDSATLVIAGNAGQQSTDSLAAPAKYGVTDRVKFVGRVDPADLPALYSGAVATCLVSHEEGFGLPVIESLACGTPVVVSAAVGVVSSLGGIGDIVAVVDSESVESITNGLEKVAPLGNREEVCQKCLTVGGRFSWYKAAGELMATFR